MKAITNIAKNKTVYTTVPSVFALVGLYAVYTKFFKVDNSNDS